MAVFDWISSRVFNAVHRNNLVYNTCWEDPRLDRVALELGPSDNVLVITSAGCNALDYALTGVNHVYAVDMNPRQNALLDLKLAAIRNLDYDDYFAMFGEGYVRGVVKLYQSKLRPDLGDWSRRYWDRKIRFFESRRGSFYFHGTSGIFARAVKIYNERVIKVRPYLQALLEAKTVEEQREIYERDLRKRFWTRTLRFAMNRDATLSMVGVPKAQRRQVELHYEGGIVQFIHDCIEAVFARLPLADNYFWRVYLTGKYTPQCCPEYLKPENHQKLRDGAADAVSTHTDSVQGFLEKSDVSISRYVLLDHMDWLSDKYFPLLVAEWKAIFQRAAPRARLIWRSGGLRTDYLDRVRVEVGGRSCPLNELLAYNQDLATKLHAVDRVHTYGSFYIAQMVS